MRLDKFISDKLICTRSDAKKIIKNKNICINNMIISNSDYQLKLGDIVYYKDKTYEYNENSNSDIYLMMNKPSDYVCAKIDNVNRTVMDLINKNEYNINELSIVGRLDKDTTGLLIITTDGMLIHQLTSPKKGCIKKYYVKTDVPFTESDIKFFKEGIIINDDEEKYQCKEAKLEIFDDYSYISIEEGKFHQIKKMCISLGKKVLYLKRVKIGSLELDESLNFGEYRELTKEEIDLLKNN